MVGAAKTGSGKTLAFLVPVLEVRTTVLLSEEYYYYVGLLLRGLPSEDYYY